MSKIKCPVWTVIVGVCLLWGMAGCSSRLETSVLSEKPPPEPEVIQPQEEPVASSQPLVSDAKIGEQDLSKPPRDIPIDEPAEPVIRRSPTKKVGAAPQEELEKAKPTEKSGQAGGGSEPLAGAPLATGIPPLLFDPESPADPTIRGEASEQVAMLEPESVDVPGNQGMATPGGAGEGIPPSMFDPEVPTDPTLRGEHSGEIAEFGAMPGQPVQPAVREEPLEVVKGVPGALVIPSNSLADVYFDYDRFSLHEDSAQKLDANAQLLVGQLSDRQVVIEGHCDERGTQSYNMILGERRAQAVKKFLVDLGVPEENMEVISLGKEKPFCTDHSLKCWQENRRGHFVLQ